mmetsp:Transcript_38828/g.86766  ORF Transcript_38828/g.86766 Transcript_38828/m.86766 type:complete len:247 (-) Transcript_38828:508-1248(-)
MPPPMHIVTTTFFAPRRLPSRRMWPTCRLPVMPKGWPIAMAPPFTLSFAGSIPSARWFASATTENASLSSHRSMSSTVRPCLSSSLGTATDGPMPITSGAHPPTAKPLKTPRASRPRRSTTEPDATTHAEAPSLSWDALPAVTVAWGLASSMIGLSAARVSRVVPGLLQSSLSHTASLYEISLVSLLTSFIVTCMGAISSENLPACWAAAHRFWLWSAYASRSSRLTASRCATKSAVSIMGIQRAG